MIITSQSVYNNRYQTITYRHDLLSPHDRHSGITKYRDKYWIGYKLSDFKTTLPFFLFAKYKISLYCTIGKDTDQGEFVGGWLIHYWYSLYTYISNT